MKNEKTAARENRTVRMDVSTCESNLVTASRMLASARAAYRVHARAGQAGEDDRLAAGEEIERWRQRVRGCLEDLGAGL